ncbi:MAG: OPT/YSL family transporter [Myxococcota bacterium]
MGDARVRPYPELSVIGVSLGALQGVVMTAAFVYIALKLGFGLPGSTVAAIVGFTLLRGVLRRKSIVENNINQTVASGINTASSGLVFTLPALLLLSVDDASLRDYPFAALIFATIAGSLMGIVLIIPLRKQMIEIERLRFPSGVAVATLLRSPGEGLSQGMLLLGGGILAAIVTVAVNMGFLPGLFDPVSNVAALAGLDIPPWVPFAIAVSTANLGAGLLSGKGGLPFFFGGVLAWWVLAPVAVNLGWVEPSFDLQGSTLENWRYGELYGSMLRPLGIGLLIGGAIAGIFSAAPAVVGAMKSLAAAAKAAKESGASPEELPPAWVYGGAIGAFILLFISAYLAPGVELGGALLIAVVGSIWLGVAGIIVATATGHTDISPLSGLALIAVTLMYFLTGGNVTASIIVGVAICIAINQCADMMSDLKTGHLVGSRPRDQQIAQLLLCWIGPLVALGVLFLLWYMPGAEGGGFGPESIACKTGAADCLSAPQADALQSVVAALENNDSAVDKYVGGAMLGGALSIFPIGGIAVLVGLAMYLPFDITLGYGLGCMANMGLQKDFGPKFIGRKLVPVAAGFIVGEALIQLAWTLGKLALGGS